MSAMLSLTKKAPDEGDVEEKKEAMNTEPVTSPEEELKAKEEKAKMEAEEQKAKEEEERKKQEEEKPLTADELRRKRLERLQTGIDVP